jgi:hypothetical protein
MKSCFLLTEEPATAVSLIYIFPRTGEKWMKYGRRFASRYQTFRPTTKHRLFVVSNGGPPTAEMKAIFKPLNATWIIWNNQAWDIGAYQYCAKTIPCEVMACFGASVYFTKSGWLERIVDSVKKHGIGLYGAMGNQGNMGFRIWPHLRTTGFWFHPALLNAYPIRITGLNQRYEFEHGASSFAQWCKSQNIERWMVTYSGEYREDDWNKISNGYHRGDQSNLLCGDRLTEPPYFMPVRPAQTAAK